MIRDDINWSRSSFKVVSPNFEGFEDGQNFLVMYIIIQFCGVEGPRIESDGIYLVVDWEDGGQNFCESIVGGVSFDNEGCIRNPMHEDQSSHEGSLECFKGF